MSSPSANSSSRAVSDDDLPDLTESSSSCSDSPPSDTPAPVCRAPRMSLASRHTQAPRMSLTTRHTPRMSVGTWPRPMTRSERATLRGSPASSTEAKYVAAAAASEAVRLGSKGPAVASTEGSGPAPEEGPVQQNVHRGAIANIDLSDFAAEAAEAGIQANVDLAALAAEADAVSEVRDRLGLRTEGERLEALARRRMMGERLEVVERRDLEDREEAQRRFVEGRGPKPTVEVKPKRQRPDIIINRVDRESNRAQDEAIQAGKRKTAEQLRYEIAHHDEVSDVMIARALLLEEFREAYRTGRPAAQRGRRVPPCPRGHSELNRPCEADGCEEKSVFWPLPLRGRVLHQPDRGAVMGQDDADKDQIDTAKPKKATPRSVVRVHQLRGVVVKYPDYTMRIPAQPAFNMDRTLHRFLVEVYGRAPTYRELNQYWPSGNITDAHGSIIAMFEMTQRFGCMPCSSAGMAATSMPAPAVLSHLGGFRHERKMEEARDIGRVYNDGPSTRGSPDVYYGPEFPIESDEDYSSAAEHEDPKHDLDDNDLYRLAYERFGGDYFDELPQHVREDGMMIVKYGECPFGGHALRNDYSPEFKFGDCKRCVCDRALEAAHCSNSCWDSQDASA